MCLYDMITIVCGYEYVEDIMCVSTYYGILRRKICKVDFFYSKPET